MIMCFSSDVTCTVRISGLHLLQGGTRAAPAQLNDQNREEPSTYWATSERCNYFVGASPPTESGAYPRLHVQALAVKHLCRWWHG